MEDWRRSSQWEVQSGFDGPRTPGRSKLGRPPPPPPTRSGSWQQSVPAWEKRFCTHVCRMPWKKLCETKRVMSIYKSVVQWDDVAGEEAFQNAKARYWAEINGQHCGIPLADPDMYIDNVDWDCDVDPELYSDLDNPPDVPEETMESGKPGLTHGWDACLSEQLVVCTGWGDADDVANPVKDSPAETGWGNSNWDIDNKNGNNDAWDGSGWRENNLENNVWSSGWGDADNMVNPVKDSPAEHGWGNSDWGVDNKNGNNNSWDCRGWGDTNLEKNVWGTGWDDSRGWGRSGSVNHMENNFETGRYGKKRDIDLGNRSRYMVSRFHGDDYRTNNWRNCRGKKRGTYVYERQPYRYSCVPMNNRSTGESGSTWRLEKPVS
ncbi:hypothetical protein QJS04_geneDACA003671 [Acorus gramineus]|uniref:Uncharacterized protein n=1 Tax=Acorus gramineus TaxID=55184 RepID=A0AAV9BM92_ACOGR|nr:hypothetical protein QJS04_geneDACA003671 [Acorus gramineus]